jgi:hypothetical protein
VKIYDKADWQIDGGVSKQTVIKHFKLVFEWLKDHHYLNNDGLEVLELNDFANVSLNDSLLTKEGNDFMSRYYDKLIKEVPYGDESIPTRLDAIYTSQG